MQVSPTKKHRNKCQPNDPNEAGRGCPEREKMFEAIGPLENVSVACRRSRPPGNRLPSPPISAVDPLNRAMMVASTRARVLGEVLAHGNPSRAFTTIERSNEVTFFQYKYTNARSFDGGRRHACGGLSKFVSNYVRLERLVYQGSHAVVE